MDLVGDLGGDFMKGQGGDETDHRAREAEADGNEVGVADRGQFREAVDPPAHSFIFYLYSELCPLFSHANLIYLEDFSLNLL
jgi:hypothetical protein